MTMTDQRVPVQAPEPSAAARREHRVPLLGGRATGCYRRRGRWAITPGGVNAHPEDRERALSTYLDRLRADGLRPLFTGLADPLPFVRRGLDTHHYTDEAVLGPGRFDLSAMGRLARDVLAARDRLVVLPCRQVHRDAVDAIFSAALAHGCGGETWVAVDRHGQVRGAATWTAPGPCGGTRSDRSERTRTLTTAAVHRLAPPGTAELLIADAVAEYRDRGVTCLELGRRRRAVWWPAWETSCGRMPRRPAGAVIDRFGPLWQPRWLGLYSRWALPAAAAALRGQARC